MSPSGIQQNLFSRGALFFPAICLCLLPWTPRHGAKINSTVGVARLVSFDGQPKALPPDLIAGLMARCDTQGRVLPPDQFAPGDELQVMSGPFAEYVATIEKIDAEQRIWLLMEFMGQKTRMAVSAGAGAVNKIRLPC